MYAGKTERNKSKNSTFSRKMKVNRGAHDHAYKILISIKNSSNYSLKSFIWYLQRGELINYILFFHTNFRIEKLDFNIKSYPYHINTDILMN